MRSYHGEISPSAGQDSMAKHLTRRPKTPTVRPVPAWEDEKSHRQSATRCEGPVKNRIALRCERNRIRGLGYQQSLAFDASGVSDSAGVNLLTALNVVLTGKGAKYPSTPKRGRMYNPVKAAGVKLVGSQHRTDYNLKCIESCSQNPSTPRTCSPLPRPLCSNRKLARGISI